MADRPIATFSGPNNEQILLVLRIKHLRPLREACGVDAVKNEWIDQVNELLGDPERFGRALYLVAGPQGVQPEDWYGEFTGVMMQEAGLAFFESVVNFTQRPDVAKTFCLKIRQAIEEPLPSTPSDTPGNSPDNAASTRPSDRSEKSNGLPTDVSPTNGIVVSLSPPPLGRASGAILTPAR